MSTQPAAATVTPQTRQEAEGIFAAIWPAIEAAMQKQKAVLPRRILWLGGAPGAGKGTNTRLILKTVGISAPALVTSDLLQTPEMKAIKDAGGLVGDKEVVGLLFIKMLEPQYAGGMVVDGFPRTLVQGELVKLLRDKMAALNRQDAGHPKPAFDAVVLAVEEKQAVERQLKRGTQIKAHNAEVEKTGKGEKQELRATDVDPEAARKRFRVFMEQTAPVLAALKSEFAYHYIDATGDIPTVEKLILKEFGTR